MSQALQDKVAIVTGAGRGLGKAFALAYADEGAKLLLPDISLERAENTAEEIRAKGGKAVANLKLFAPDSSFSWFVLEFDGKDTFFGLVEGLEKELGYFSLAELQSVRGPLGLPIERDFYWRPKTLKEIAPELFTPVRQGQ